MSYKGKRFSSVSKHRQPGHRDHQYPNASKDDNDGDIVILSSDDEDNDNKCMICYCTLTESQLARVLALMIDSTDSTKIFNNYCRLLNIKLLENINWDFSTESMPFCSACLAMVKTLAQLSDKLTSIKVQINGILDIIKSEIVKSSKEEGNKIVSAKGKGRRYLSSLEKVNYCRKEVIKDVAPTFPKTESPDDSKSPEDLPEVYTLGETTSAAFTSDLIEQGVRRMQSQCHEVNKPKYLQKNCFFGTSNLKPCANKRKLLPKKEIHQHYDIRDQIMQISSTQHPGHLSLPPSEIIDPCHSSTPYNPLQSDLYNIPTTHSELSEHVNSTHSNHAIEKGIAHTSTSNTSNIPYQYPPDTILVEGSSKMMEMEDTTEFSPWQLKDRRVDSSIPPIPHKRSRVTLNTNVYSSEPLPSRISQDGESECVIEGDRSNFVNVNVEVLEIDCKEAYKCKVCGHLFTTRNSATTHIQAVHLKVKKIQCKICTKTFFKKFNCVVHINKMHLKGDTTINAESAVVYLVD